MGVWQISGVGVEEHGRGREREGCTDEEWGPVRPAWTGGNGGAVVVENLRRGEAKSGRK